MLLCMGILEDELARTVKYNNYSDGEYSFVLERFEIYSGSRALSSGVVYLARWDDLPANLIVQENTGMICLGTPPAFYMNPPLELLVLEDDNSLRELSNEINRIFFEYNALEYELQRSIYKGLNIQRFVDLVAPYFNGNEVQVGGANYKILGRSNKTVHVSELSGIAQPDNDDLIAPEFLNFFKNDINFSKARDRTEPFIYGPSILPCRLLCMNVFQHDEYVCRCFVAEDRNPFRPYEIGMIRFFTSYVQLLYDISEKNTDFIPRSTLSDTLTALLAGEDVTSAQLALAIAQRQWHIEGPFVCICIMLSERDYYNRTIQYYCQQYNREQPGCRFVEFEHFIVGIAELNYYNNTSEVLIHTLCETFRDNNFRAGYSAVFDRIEQLRFYYTQAEITLRIGQIQYPYVWFHRFSDIAIHYIRSKITEDLDAEFLCTPEILTLYKHDKENQSDYLRSLKVFIDNNMNTVKAANSLFIHRATMIYRLKRIQEISKLDLDGLGNNLHALLSIDLLLNG